MRRLCILQKTSVRQNEVDRHRQRETDFSDLTFVKDSLFVQLPKLSSTLAVSCLQLVN